MGGKPNQSTNAYQLCGGELPRQIFDELDGKNDPVLGALFETYFPLLCENLSLNAAAEESRLRVLLGRALLILACVRLDRVRVVGGRGWRERNRRGPGR